MLGTKFITIARACTLLGISKATIYRYLKRGLLRPAREGKILGVWEEEVLHFKLNQAHEIPVAVNRMTFSMLTARVQSLESMVNTLARILNVRYQPLALTDPEFQLLYDMATMYSEQGWPPHDEERWVDTFCRIKHEDFEQLARITGDEHPWRPILRLAKSMHLRCYNIELRDQFASGLTNVDHSSGVYCTLVGATPTKFHLLVERDAVPNKKLIKKLGKTRKGPEPQKPPED